jgi:hypothetical protein
MIMMKRVAPYFTANSTVANVQTLANLPVAKTLAQVGFDLVSLPFDQLLVTHGDTLFVWRRYKPPTGS